MTNLSETESLRQVALIVGGASGIGLATAGKFLQSGVCVMLADVNTSAGQLRCRELQQAYGEDACAFVSVDVTNSSSVEAMAETTHQRWGRIDFLINSAGLGATPSLPHMLDDAEFERTLGVNLSGVFRSMKAVIPVMLRQKSGSIVNLGSVGGMHPMPYGCDYGASKAAVIFLSRSMAQAYGRNGIRVNVVSPAWVDTPMIDEVVERKGPEMREKMKSDIPLGRIGCPEEIAGTVYYVACDASFMSGSNVTVDGGMAS
ncbi:MAG: SDR family oxidoreductase [Verrucomicrobiota bacterium]